MAEGREEDISDLIRACASFVSIPMYRIDRDIRFAGIIVNDLEDGYPIWSVDKSLFLERRLN